MTNEQKEIAFKYIDDSENIMRLEILVVEHIRKGLADNNRYNVVKRAVEKIRKMDLTVRDINRANLTH